MTHQMKNTVLAGTVLSESDLLASSIGSDTTDTPIALQASKLCRIYAFAHDTARTIAALAYGVLR
jgi:hypothetical protein